MRVHRRLRGPFYGLFAFLAGAAELLDWQQGIHRPGTEALQIESHELESELLEDGRKLGGHRWVQCAVQFLAGNLDADDLSVMANAKLPKSETRE